MIEATSKYVNHLFNELKQAVNEKDWSEAEKNQKLIESLPEAGEAMKSTAKKILEEAQGEDISTVEKTETEEASELADITDLSSLNTNPQDALKEARRAILANDQNKCISILKKQKASPTVLDLLATCYKSDDQMKEYYSTLKSYVNKYPDSPKAQKYTKILKDNGNL